MPYVLKWVRHKRLAITSVIVAVFVFIGAKKAFDYASPQTKEKDCDFAFPDAVDQTKLTKISAGVPEHDLKFLQKGGTINDASCLNKTPVYGVVKISTTEDIRNSLRFARENDLKVTSAGQRHSMGGQSFIKNGLVLEMRGFNRIKLDKERKVLNAQAGATWIEIQRFLDENGLAVKAMQSFNIFTVGGTLSVNAHGVAHTPGPIAGTVRSLRVMSSDGEIKTASPTENPELFRSVLGGYGLFGVILDADLEVVDNDMYKLTDYYIDYKEFPEFYGKNIENNQEVGLVYARLSVAPTSYLTEMAVHTYTKVKYDGKTPKMLPAKHVWLYRLIFNFSKTGGFGRWVRWTLERYVEPLLHVCHSRNQAMSQQETCLSSRNQEMYDSGDYVKGNLKDTDIIQEYFIPPEKLADFVDGLKILMEDGGANLVNVTVRIVHKDTVTAMPYAKQDMFGVTLFFNQKLNEKESLILRKTTADLVELAISLNGTFYLPYQLYYSQEQLHKAYPEIDAFFAAKKKYDPTGLFSNKFYDKYGT